MHAISSFRYSYNRGASDNSTNHSTNSCAHCATRHRAT
jgi:hypothetical protein